MANGSVVYVASKLNNDLLCRLFEWVDGQEPGPTGPRAVKVSRQIVRDGEPLQFLLKGHNPGPTARLPSGFIIEPRYRTTKVARELYELYVEQNRDSDLLRNKVIFAASTESDINAMIKEHESSIRTGLEPIITSHDIKKQDPRIVVDVFRRGLGIATADEMPPR
jgi:hypothetical protein